MNDRLTEEQCRRLLSVLRVNAGTAVHFAEAPRRLSGATFSDVFGFSLEGAPPSWRRALILRFFPSSLPIDQVRLEQAVQNAAADQGFPAPRVLLRHDEPEVLGASFIVMERMPGRPVLGGTRPDLFARDFPLIFWRWPARVASVLRDLQALDTQRVLVSTTMAGVDDSYAYAGRHVDYVLQHLGSHADDGLGNILGWLDAHRPATPVRPVLVHGDLWPANVLCHRGELTAVVDWNRSGIGHPALDVGFAAEGFALMPEPFPPPPPLAHALRAAGASIAGRICSAVDIDDEAVHYFRVLRCLLELACVAAETAATKGQPVSAWARSVQRLTTRASELTGVPATVPTALNGLDGPPHR